MPKSVNIQGRVISCDEKPFIVAEMSGNHNHSLERALAIVDAAASAGADAIKLQTYTADTLTIDYSENEFFISDKNSLWKGKSLYQLYQTAYTPWEWHEAIFKRAKERGLIAFSSAFDETSVDFLENLNVPCYKIASFENNHLPLLRKVAKTGKPVILSTGVSTLQMIEEAVRTLRENGSGDIILMKCTSTYPANPENSNLLTIPHLAQMFDCYVGLSDHTLGIGVAVASVALGARVIEKHFCLSRDEGGVDSAFSLQPEELKRLVEECNRAFLSLGKVHYGILDDERSSLVYKRSIYVVKDIKAGEKLTTENIRIIRPGLGLQPSYYEFVLGKVAKRDIKRGTALQLDMLM